MTPLAVVVAQTLLFWEKTGRGNKTVAAVEWSDRISILPWRSVTPLRTERDRIKAAVPAVALYLGRVAKRQPGPSSELALEARDRLVRELVVALDQGDYDSSWERVLQCVLSASLPAGSLPDDWKPPHFWSRTERVTQMVYRGCTYLTGVAAAAALAWRYVPGP